MYLVIQTWPDNECGHSIISFSSYEEARSFYDLELEKKNMPRESFKKQFGVFADQSTDICLCEVLRGEGVF